MEFDKSFAVVFCRHVDLRIFVVVYTFYHDFLAWNRVRNGRLYNQA